MLLFFTPMLLVFLSLLATYFPNYQEILFLLIGVIVFISMFLLPFFIHAYSTCPNCCKSFIVIEGSNRFYKSSNYFINKCANCGISVKEIRNRGLHEKKL